MELSRRVVDPRLERALHSAFGSPKKVEEQEDQQQPVMNNYRPQIYVAMRLARCPSCSTWARHKVERVFEAGKGKLLECVWCWGLFNTKGNCV